MNINDFIITFAKALKADYFFKNIKIIKPFENVSYAGEIKNTFVCVGLDEMEITPIELGDDTKYANVKIKVGIFTEKNNSAFAKDVFLNICRVSQKFNITSIKAQPLSVSMTRRQETSAPASARISFRKSPSLPTAPACSTCAPARAAATDWFSPFPPALTLYPVAIMVSPG